ncbi:MAG TPA: ABC transporter ATP-binding protein, partial [Candidatus Dormibacteraeota bacterium]|nr:ABC transporter ATP-binding protein [Candidatus Dormibacteraeota bacterium]
MINVNDLVKHYKKAERNAVDGITFNVEQGTFFALLGPNGAGKTTTISILTTTLAPTSGTVNIAGYDIVAQQSEVRRSVGIVFQKPSLDLNLTAEENVRFHAQLYGLYPFRPTFSSMPAKYRGDVENLADVLGIRRDIFKPIKTFSGGMKRKLEILRSLIHTPSVLFLDEPTAGLDADSRRNLWDYLKRVRQQSGTTVFVTTHYLEEAEEADVVCIVDNGRIVTMGPPDTVKHAFAHGAVVLDAADRDRLRSELRRLGLQFTEHG